tara:strand:+ start:364 stop:864 length:501 start_codon:yes stop_codon:yes gene_type:complete
MKQKILYLDRDGIINEHIPYVGTLERFHVIKEIHTITNFFYQKGFRIVVVTNQSGIERGFYSLFDFFKLSQYIIDLFKEHNIDIEIRACPHLPSRGCHCRKPNIGMLKDLRSENDVFIGDQDTDMIAAKRAGIKNRWLISKKFESSNATKNFLSHKSLIEYLYCNI